MKREPTARELQVLRMIAEGLTTTEMMERLGVTRRGITGHRDSLLVKLGARNAPHSVALGYDLGYLERGAS